MGSWIEEHFDELVARYAEEDHCTPDSWKERAVLSVVRKRYEFEQAWHDTKERQKFEDWSEGQ